MSGTKLHVNSSLRWNLEYQGTFLNLMTQYVWCVSLTVLSYSLLYEINNQVYLAVES